MTTQTLDGMAVANSIHAAAQTYAATLAKLTGAEWTYQDLRDTEARYTHACFVLTHAPTQVRISFSCYDIDRGRVYIRPMTPPLPDGPGRSPVRSSLSDFTGSIYINGVRQSEILCELDITAKQFLEHTDRTARRIAAEVWAPYHDKVLPLVREKIAALQAGFDCQHDIVAALCAKFNGTARTTLNGGSATIHVSFADSNLQPVDVDQYGYIRFGYTPSLSLGDIDSLYSYRTRKPPFSNVPR